MPVLVVRAVLGGRENPGEWVTLVDADWVDEDYIEFRTAGLLKHSLHYADSFPDADPPWGSDNMIVHEFTGPIRPARPLYLR